MDAADTSTLAFTTGSNINTWKDKSTSGLTATYGGTPPVYTTYNGYSAIQFSGSNYFTTGTLPSSTLDSTGITYFAVVTQTNNTQAQAGVIASASPEKMIRYDGYYCSYTINNGTIRGIQNDYTSGVKCFVDTASSLYTYTNGAVTSSNLTAVSYTPQTTSTFFQIGAWGSTYRYYGYINEIIIYNTALTTNQRQSVENYLMSKWGISNVTSHPFKSIPPSTSQPPQFQEVTPGNWTYDWKPYLQRLAAANSSATAVFSSNAVSGLETTANASWGMNLAPNGLIYTFPTNSSYIGIINPTTSVYTSNAISTGLGSGGYKYIGGGGLHPNGNIYVPPANGGVNVGIFTPSGSSGTFTTIASTTNSASDAFGGGGVLAPNGMIYFIPQGSAYIGRIDTTGTFSSNAVSGTVPTGDKYRGAALAPNGLIYCIPDGVLLNVGVINPTTNTYSSNYVTMVDSTVNYAFLGAVLAPNGKIYCIPNRSTTVGIIDPVANTFKNGPALSSGTNAVGTAGYGNQAYYGGCLGPDGNIYCTPCLANNILIINPITETVSYLSTGFTSPQYLGMIMAPNGTLYMKPAGNGPAGSSNVATISFTGLKQLPSLNWCLSPYANRSL
jgi:hypothetical protein